MAKTRHSVDLCIIGAGSGGLSIASGAAQLGRSVVLYERSEMGGDCLNSGCVPSKALIAAGKHAQAFRTGAPFGIEAAEPNVDFAAMQAHVKDVIATIAPIDSQERFEGMGCTVIRESARFSGPNEVQSDSYIVKAKRIIIATGSVASIPPIDGLDGVKYQTNETIFDLEGQPKTLMILGAGPIGFELGQAFQRLGTAVHIIDLAEPLGKMEPEHARVLIEALKSEGVTFHAPAKTKSISQRGKTITITFEDGQTLKGDCLLVATGRKPVTEGLDLDKAGIETVKHGYIDTDDCLRTTNKSVYAVGDVSGKGGLTHAAGYHASVIIKAFYFLPPLIARWKGKATTDRMPASIYSQPELATIGVTENAAIEKFGADKVRCVSWDYADNDRAIAERHTGGGVKLVATKGGTLLGASIVGPQAGELIHVVSAAMANNIKISGLTGMISPYPTRGEAIKRAAGSWYTDKLFGPFGQFIAKTMSRFH
ncbi:dihydrolipoyl dehydrogenase family protein [Robiginitomaculum antarcticum]|uniref:dihydrolipoyl dehydrogenase family protein n=1 Tax=Robiginitomaculum antarcticum TaxID=437507 RepID=UPI00037E2088|nr:FAD-dependent oxidoreductase [Robiginitomaculum antarcticum]